MGGKKPIFLSAPRLVLGTLDDNGIWRKIAYAIGLSVNVSVNVQPIYTLGSFAPISYEPTMLNPVTGTFQIVRLQKKAQRVEREKTAAALYAGKEYLFNTGAPSAEIKTTQDPGKDPTYSIAYSATQNPYGDNAFLEQSEYSKHLDPVQVLNSKTFDIEVYMSTAGFGLEASDVEILNQNGQNVEVQSDLSAQGLVKWMTIRDCRITGRNMNLAVGQLVNEPLNFMGLVAITGTEEFDDRVKEGII